MSPDDYFVQRDANNEQTLWRHRGPLDPEAVLRQCELPRSARHLWPSICAAMVQQSADARVGAA
jgi:hypothetical protein